MIINWKTTLSGVVMILGAIVDVLTYAVQGTVTPHIEADFTAVIGGIGLIFAKDKNVTGGTTQQ